MKYEPLPLAPAPGARPLAWLLGAVTLAFALVLWPFNGAVWWAVFIAIVFSSWQRRLLHRLGARRNLAALLTLGAVLLMVILPLVLLTGAIGQEVTAFAERLRSGELDLAAQFRRVLALLPGWALEVLNRLGFADLGNLQQKLMASLGQSGQALTGRVFVLGQHTLDFLVSFCLMLYVLFFLLRDGPDLSARVLQAVPLAGRHKRVLADKFVSVVRATVKGNILVALIQGLLGGLAFWVLGITGALLWGALMAALSLLPAVGAALVWAPVALYLVATGAVWQGLGLALWGALVIGLVDNLLRPILVGKETRIPDYVVLLSTVGGIALFGINGFVIGPVIAGMFLAAWEIQARERAVAEASTVREPASLGAADADPGPPV